MPDHPPAGHPDILMHGWGRGTDHPAVPVAFPRTRPYFLRLLRVPKLVPRLLSEISHDRLLLHPVTGNHIAERVDKEGIFRHITGQQAFVAVYIVDLSVI